MSEKNPTLQDIWKLLGVMNKRFGMVDQRFDALEREMVDLKTGLCAEMANLRSEMVAGFGSLKASIEARDFRLDEHGRRLSELERSRT
ncbi:MAG TPA: hypothetical protein VJN18_25280 [Polyangiaceae bacterium]|nr:hypothetical protein [Polyangiaceae bacterium]